MKILPKIEIGMVWGLILLSMLACRTIFPVSAPTPTPQPIPSVDELRFADSETGQRFRALDRCIQNMVDDTWQTNSYHLSGNFYTASWCRGSGARSDCQIANASMDDRDQQVIELNTLSYSLASREVFGLGLYAHWVPKTTGWGASFSFAEKGERIVGDGFGVTFSEYQAPTGKPEAAVSLGWSYGYIIYGPHQTTFEVTSTLPLREDLALYLSAPEAMRDRGLAQIQALAQKVDQALRGHQVNGCDLGPYLGKGLPPVCTLRPLTPSEEAEELVKAETYFAGQEQLLRDGYQEMYATWMMAFPLDQCWP